MRNLAHKLEILANFSILIVAIAILGVIYKEYGLSTTRVQRSSEIAVGAVAPIKPLAKISSRNSLVLALNTQCHFCRESAPFYKNLAQELGKKQDIHVIAVFPQPTTEAREYLNQLRIPISDVQQVAFGTIPIAGTPTLLLLDPSGKVMKKWIGKLRSDEEETVWKTLGCAAAGQCS